MTSYGGLRFAEAFFREVQTVNERSSLSLLLCSAAALFLLCGAADAGDGPAAASAKVRGPEIWMCTARIRQLLEPDAKWDFLRKHLTGVKLYIGTLRKTPQAQLARLAALLKKHGLQIAVECGGTLGFAPLDETNGEKSAEMELRAINRWYRAGGRVDFLDLDGPVRRLLYRKRRGKRVPGFTSVDKCATELMDYIRAVRRVHPKIRFFLLTNFPNWGYRGGVSYHARGPKRQDWGDYHAIVTTVLAKAKADGIEFAGVTVDNPYEYAVGEHFSVKLKDPTKVDWIARIRAYEDFARKHKLEFNLIINSEKGGKTSDAAFMKRTLKMLDAYRKAGGAPTRYVVQSWYPHPGKIVPEDAADSMGALVKEAIRRTHPQAK
jgi:hypothetical protein